MRLWRYKWSWAVPSSGPMILFRFKVSTWKPTKNIQILFNWLVDIERGPFYLLACYDIQEFNVTKLNETSPGGLFRFSHQINEIRRTGSVFFASFYLQIESIHPPAWGRPAFLLRGITPGGWGHWWRRLVKFGTCFVHQRSVIASAWRGLAFEI